MGNRFFGGVFFFFFRCILSPVSATANGANQSNYSFHLSRRPLSSVAVSPWKRDASEAQRPAVGTEGSDPNALTGRRASLSSRRSRYVSVILASKCQLEPIRTERSPVQRS